MRQRTSPVQRAKPPLRPQTTTLWEYPSQHYGRGMQGDKAYVGATPSYVIWNVLQRYSRAGDCVVDPMCGSGTTLDVAANCGRRALGFDIHPARHDVAAADARALPLAARCADVVFFDPPYGDHIHYSDAPGCIGRLSATQDAYFEALDDVLAETWRILRPGGVAAVYVCDYFKKRQGFVPIGARLLFGLAQRFEVLDHICVVRHNKSLQCGNWHQAAERDNFFLRGFNHLLLGRKT